MTWAGLRLMAGKERSKGMYPYESVYIVKHAYRP
jgi:hypothetical protein